MPRFNEIGPFGRGPMTGRGLGPCAGGYGRGFGWSGRGLAFGRRWTEADERSALDEEEEILKQELAEVQAAKKDLEKKK